MKNRLTILFLLLYLSLICTGCAIGKKEPAGDGKLSVCTSFYAMYDFASKIGGDKINILNMVPAGTEPHDWEPSASDIANLEKADIFIYNGIGMESWTDKVLSSLENKKLTAVQASSGISLLGGTDKGDPHIWLSPEKAKREMENIKNALSAKDPGNKNFYEENYKKYSAEFDALDGEFCSKLSPLPKKDIVVAHQAFGYLCADYGLNQIPIEGLSADSEPNPAKMAEIISIAKQKKIKVIFFEELVSPKVSETIAKAASAETKVLNPLEGLTDEQEAKGEDYFSLMRENLSMLEEALS
ncbi:MAG: metal ABC transporter substrate-binding protein [Bacillota bacterium]|nr:metal ABC transporter substrate-binding protein [Bacillota bacterium]